MFITLLIGWLKLFTLRNIYYPSKTNILKRRIKFKKKYIGDKNDRKKRHQYLTRDIS